MKYRTAALLLGATLPFTQLACADDEPENSVPDDVWSLVEEYSAAWNDYDGGEFLATVTDDYVFVWGATENDSETQAGYIGEGSLANSGWSSEVIGDPIVAGDGPYDLAVTHLVTMNGTTSEGLSLITVVDDGGELKVAEHVWTG